MSRAADLRTAAELTAHQLSAAQDSLVTTVERLLAHAGAALPHRARLQGDVDSIHRLRQLLDQQALELRTAEAQERNRAAAREAVARHREATA